MPRALHSSRAAISSWIAASLLFFSGESRASGFLAPAAAMRSVRAATFGREGVGEGGEEGGGMRDGRKHFMKDRQEWGRRWRRSAADQAEEKEEENESTGEEVQRVRRRSTGGGDCVWRRGWLSWRCRRSRRCCARRLEGTWEEALVWRAEESPLGSHGFACSLVDRFAGGQWQGRHSVCFYTGVAHNLCTEELHRNFGR